MSDCANRLCHCPTNLTCAGIIAIGDAHASLCIDNQQVFPIGWFPFCGWWRCRGDVAPDKVASVIRTELCCFRVDGSIAMDAYALWCRSFHEQKIPYLDTGTIGCGALESAKGCGNSPLTSKISPAASAWGAPWSRRNPAAFSKSLPFGSATA